MLNSSPPTFATQALARHMPTLAAICGHCLGGSVCKTKTAGCVRIDFLQNQTAHLKGFVEMFQDVQRLVTKMKRRIAEKRRPGILVDIDGVTITKNAIRQTVPWTRIKRIAAFRQDIYLGVVVCLAIEIEDGTTVHVIEGDPAWLDLTETLNKELPTALGKEKWFLDLAAGRQEVVLIYDRTEAAVPVTAQ